MRQLVVKTVGVTDTLWHSLLLKKVVERDSQLGLAVHISFLWLGGEVKFSRTYKVMSSENNEDSVGASIELHLSPLLLQIRKIVMDERKIELFMNI